MSRYLLAILFALFIVQAACSGDDTAEESSSAQEAEGEEAGADGMHPDEYTPGAVGIEGEPSEHEFEDPESVEPAEPFNAEEEALDEVDDDEAAAYESEEHTDRHALISALAAHEAKKGAGARNASKYKASLRGHSTGKLLKKAKKHMGANFKLSTARTVHDEQQALEGHGGSVKIGGKAHTVDAKYVKTLNQAAREKLLKQFKITKTNMKHYVALAVDRDLVRAHAPYLKLAPDAVSKMSEAGIEAKIKQLIARHQLSAADGKKRLINDLRHTRALLKTDSQDPEGKSHKEMKKAVKALGAKKAAHKTAIKARIAKTHKGTHKAPAAKAPATKS